ncbi:type II toxin-antitoxin system RelE/ParE family toxin [Haemophilus haemoglobinophilus]|nr:type II toxin-antitoxin system RelE/ParE family toxin [Canicola haemoglobinophilus]
MRIFNTKAFAKFATKQNISNIDLESLKLLAQQYATYSNEQIQFLVKNGTLIEVKQDEI